MTQPSSNSYQNRQSDKIAVVGDQGTLRSLLQKNAEALAQVVPNYLTADRMMKLAILASLKNPELLNCTRASILESVMTACQLGLEIGANSGHLVPYNKNFGTKDNPNWGKVAQFIPDYRGIIGQAKRCGAITKGVSRLVYKDDIFEVDYGADKIRHIPNLESTNRKPEDIIAVWFRVKLPDGDEQFEIMTTAEVKEIRERSKAKSSGPWVTDFGEMAKKTCVKRTMKYIPNQSPELQSAIEHDNRLESGDLGALVPLLDTEEKVTAQITEATRERTDQLAEDIKKANGQGTPSGENLACDAFEPDPKSDFCLKCGYKPEDHGKPKPTESSVTAAGPSDASTSATPATSDTQAEPVLPLTGQPLVIDGMTFPANLQSTGAKDRINFAQYDDLKKECDRLKIDLDTTCREKLGVGVDDLSKDAAGIFLQWLQQTK